MSGASGMWLDVDLEMDTKIMCVQKISNYVFKVS
jgi:hypothetical protein